MKSIVHSHVATRPSTVAAAVAIALALTATGTTRAQGAPAAAQPADSDAIGEVIVTARKRNESAHDVPISLTVLSGESMQNKGIKQIQDIMQFAPDLQQSNGMGGAFRTMRGAGSVGSNLGFEQSTGLFFDEVSYGRNPQSYLPIFDVERVEVLRGPQVITFGNSTTSGAVSVVNRKPNGRFSADASVLQEFYDHQTTVRAGVTLPLGEIASVRVAGFLDQIDKGWIKTFNLGTQDYGPNSDDAAGRITLVVDPSDALSLTLKYEHDKTRLNGTNIITTTNRLNFPFVPSTVFEPIAYKGSGAPFNLDRDAVDLNNDTVQARVDWSVGGLDITSNTSYWKYDYNYRNDSDTTPAPIATTQTLDNFSQFAQELRLSGKAGELFQYFAGVYFQSDHQDFHGVFSANRAALGTGDVRPAFARVVGVDQKAKTKSAFVSLAVPLGQYVSVEPSVRYTKVSRDGSQFAYGAEVMSTVPTTAYDAFLAGVFGATPHRYELSVPEHHWMPQLIVTYKPNSELNFFARYTDGAKSGGIDANFVSTNPAQAIFAAETVKSVEGGLKADLFDRRVSTSVTLFNSKYKDLQVNIFNDPIFVVRNAGGQRSQGVELDTNFRASPAVTVGASLTYLDAKYTDFAGAACTLSQSLTRPAPCTQDLTGHRSGFSSKWYGTAYADYQTQIGNYALNFGIDANGRSDYSPTTNDDREVGLQKAYVLLNARAEIAPTQGPWSVALFGRNLTNRIYTNFVTPGGAGQTRGVSAATLERTRQIGVELKVNF